MLRYRVVGLLVLVSIAAWGETRGRTMSRIGANQVARALSVAGMEVTPRQVQLATELSAMTPSPTLDLLEVEPSPSLNERWVWVKLGCRDPHECRPFYVSVQWNGDIRTLVKHAKSVVPASSPKDTPPVIRFGDHATLVVDVPRLRLEIAVIALQNGSAGQVIRLATPDHKKFYRGEVVGKSMLRGSL